MERHGEPIVAFFSSTSPRKPCINTRKKHWNSFGRVFYQISMKTLNEFASIFKGEHFPFMHRDYRRDVDLFAPVVSGVY